MAGKSGEKVVVNVLNVKMRPELKDLVGQAADSADLPMNEWVARLVAKHLGRPELAELPKGRAGRPRKVAAAV